MQTCVFIMCMIQNMYINSIIFILSCVNRTHTLCSSRLSCADSLDTTIMRGPARVYTSRVMWSTSLRRYGTWWYMNVSTYIVRDIILYMHIQCSRMYIYISGLCVCSCYVYHTWWIHMFASLRGLAFPPCLPSSAQRRECFTHTGVHTHKHIVFMHISSMYDTFNSVHARQVYHVRIALTSCFAGQVSVGA